MREYEEMIQEFVAISGFYDRKKWLYGLTIEQIREFRYGVAEISPWQSYIDSVISEKILENRIDRLKELGL